MITPGFYSITIMRRATFGQVIQLKGSDKQPINMSGYSVAATALNHDRTAKLADFTVTWVDQSIGKFSLGLTADQTSELSVNGNWELMVTNPDGSKDFWLRGEMVVVS